MGLNPEQTFGALGPLGSASYLKHWPKRIDSHLMLRYFPFLRFWSWQFMACKSIVI